MKVKWASTIVNVISIASLFDIFQIIFEKIIQVMLQNMIHPIIIDRKDPNHPIIELPDKVHSNIIHKTTKNKASEVQSLNKLSHSKINVNLLGAHIILKSESTATGSVSDIWLQNNKQTIKGIWNQIRGKIKNKATAINAADIKSQKTASAVILFQFFITCL